MKTKLLRIFTFLFAVSSLAALIAPPVYADKASDEAAVKLIVACKNFIGPVVPGSDCDRYRICMGADGSETCKSVRNLNPNTPGNGNEFITGCVNEQRKSRSECVNALAACYANRVADGKITAEKATECNNLVKEGKLADANSPLDTAAGDEKTTCVISGVGWILCPVLTTMSLVVDGAYAFVSSLLAVQPLVTTGETKAIYDAWSIMRNFANVAFVIAFLMIIFSQLTNVGITNYGIKKLLPRVIIAAILVNISYWICAIAIDLSNILGSSINGMFETLGAQMKLPSGGAFSGGGWVGIVGGVLAGAAVAAAVLYATLSALIPALITAALAIVTVLIVLSVRQALIILLVIVAPLAFVAYLLPNTEGWFNKWRSLFQTLLLMYPIIAGMFGASALASQIIMATATGDWKIAIQIMGALIAVAPLALTPLVMKTAGGVLGKVGAFVNNPNRGPVDRLRKRAGAYTDRRQNIARARRINGESAFSGLSGAVRGDGSSRVRRAGGWVTGKVVGATESASSGIARAGLTNEQKNANAEKALNKTKQDYIASQAAGSLAYAQNIAGPTGDAARIQAAAIAAQKNETAEAIKNAQISANIPPGNLAEMSNRLVAALRSNDDVTARAMQNMLLKSGSKGLAEYRGAMNEVTDAANPANASVDMDSGAGKALRENMLENHGGVKGQANDLMQQAITGKSMSEVSADKKTWEMPDIELAQQKPDSINLAMDAGAISQEQALRITGNEELAKYLNQPTRERMEGIATAPPTPTPTPTPPRPTPTPPPTPPTPPPAPPSP